MTITEHDIEQAFRHLQTLIPAETLLWRVKNVVMAQVRVDVSQAQLKLSFERPKLSFGQLFALRPRAVVAFIVALAVLLGGGGTVAAAQNNIPGEALYRVKLASETVVAAVLPTKKAKVNFEAKRAQRRAKELVALTKKAEAAPAEKRPQVEAHIKETTTRLEVHLARVQEVVEELKATATPEALQTTTQVTEKIEVLEKQLEAAQKRKIDDSPSPQSSPTGGEEANRHPSPVAGRGEGEGVQKELRMALDRAWETVQEVFDLVDTFEDEQHLPRTEMDLQLDEIMGLLTEAEDMFTAHNADETRRLTQAAQAKLSKVKEVLATKQSHAPDKSPDKKEEPPRDLRVKAPVQ